MPQGNEPIERATRNQPKSSLRPPIPPRRHTLAEICRYADEHCAYIELITRELEAEAAARCHSMPTTPAGAITNPFNGPADMWWRPASAREMYGRSALRRLHEEQTAINEYPYLAANGLSELLGRSESGDGEDFAQSEHEDSDCVSPPSCAPMQDYVSYVFEHESWLDEPSSHILKNLKIAQALQRYCHGVRSRQTANPATELTPGENIYSRSPIHCIVPKILGCMILLPIILVAIYYIIEAGEDGTEDDEDEREIVAIYRL